MPDCHVLLPIHPMVGCDFHNAIQTPPLPPVPMAPHFVCQIMNGLNTCAATVPKVLAHSFMTMNRGTDIGMGIGHVSIPPVVNILIPIMILGSGSVAEFGAFTVLSGGSPIATACIPSPPFSPVGMNINLNCGTVPTPTGGVIAPNTVLAGMKFGDYLASVVAMGMDFIMQVVASKICGKIVGGTQFESLIGKATTWPIVIKFAEEEITRLGVGWWVGSPIGYSFSRQKEDEKHNKIEDPTFLGQQGSTLLGGDLDGTGLGYGSLKNYPIEWVARTF
jgi:hypothetical protein